MTTAIIKFARPTAFYTRVETLHILPTQSALTQMLLVLLYKPRLVYEYVNPLNIEWRCSASTILRVPSGQSYHSMGCRRVAKFSLHTKDWSDTSAAFLRLLDFSLRGVSISDTGGLIIKNLSLG